MRDSTIRTETKTETDIRTVYQQGFKAEDKTMPYRFVGSYEYLNAINLLGQLVGMSTENEIEVYDKIIAGQPEFSFYGGVVSSIGVQTTPEQGYAGPRIEFDERFKKQSMAWLLALARVEIAATMSMYGSGSLPFNSIAPTSFGIEEYSQVLFDDLAAHLHALDTDPQFLRVSKRSTDADSDTMAYLRRLKMVDDMLLTLLQSPDPVITEPARVYRATVKKYGKRLVEKVEKATYTQEYTNTRNSSSTRSRNYREVQRGTLSASSPIYRNCQRRFLDEAN